MTQRNKNHLQVQKSALNSATLLISFHKRYIVSTIETLKPAGPFPTSYSLGCVIYCTMGCLSFPLSQFPYCSCGWVCGWTIQVPHPCFSETFRALSYACGQLAYSNESCPEQRALTVVLGTTMTTLLCWVLLSHFLSLCLQLSTQTALTHVVFFSSSLLL